MAAAAAGISYAPEDPALPKPWKGLVDDKTGYVYYWNPETNITQYEKPVAPGRTSYAPAHKSLSSSVQKSPQGRYNVNDNDDRYSKASNGSTKASVPVAYQATRSRSDYSQSDAEVNVSVGYGPLVSNGAESIASAEAYRRRHEISVTKDGNAKGMRYKPWPMLEDWKEIFGNDRATGENAEDVLEAVHDIYQEEHLGGADIGNDYHVNLDDIFENDAHEDSVCQSQQRDQPPRQTGKKRKGVDEIRSVCNLLSEMHRDTNARLENLASRIGYEADLGKARKEVFDQLGDIPGLSLNDKFDVCEILAEKVGRLEIFMGLPADARPQYVMRLLRT